MTVQYDLFGQTEAAEARAERDRQPQMCDLCGKTEPTGWLLRNNHGTRLDASECWAMYLTRNHVLWSAKHGNSEHLDRDLARARDVWRHHLDALAASLADHGLDPDGRPL